MVQPLRTDSYFSHKTFLLDSTENIGWYGLEVYLKSKFTLFKGVIQIRLITNLKTVTEGFVSFV